MQHSLNDTNNLFVLYNRFVSFRLFYRFYITAVLASCIGLNKIADRGNSKNNAIKTIVFLVDVTVTR